METSRVVIDTSLFIQYLRATKKERTAIMNLPSQYTPVVSCVTVFELFTGANKPEKEEQLNDLLEGLEVLPLTEAISKQAASVHRVLKANNQLIEFRDIFIGVTAQMHRLPLATLNTKHFERIPELVLLDLA